MRDIAAGMIMDVNFLLSDIGISYWSVNKIPFIIHTKIININNLYTPNPSPQDSRLQNPNSQSMLKNNSNLK